MGLPLLGREGGSEDEEAGPLGTVVQWASGAPPYIIIFKDTFVCGLMYVGMSVTLYEHVRYFHYVCCSVTTLKAVKLIICWILIADDNF